MGIVAAVSVLPLLLATGVTGAPLVQKPHIVLIVADGAPFILLRSCWHCCAAVRCCWPPAALLTTACWSAPFADQGYAQMPYHNSTMLMPRIDEIAKAGVILEGYYVQPICSPTRSSLMVPACWAKSDRNSNFLCGFPVASVLYQRFDSRLICFGRLDGTPTASVHRLL
jgi:hypothetical protein